MNQLLSSDPSLKQRLEREAKAISKLSHPHICALHDIGHQDGIDFLVMEYLEGETLEHRLIRGPVAPDQALRYAAEIADIVSKTLKYNARRKPESARRVRQVAVCWQSRANTPISGSGQTTIAAPTQCCGRKAS